MFRQSGPGLRRAVSCILLGFLPAANAFASLTWLRSRFPKRAAPNITMSFNGFQIGATAGFYDFLGIYPDCCLLLL